MWSESWAQTRSSVWRAKTWAGVGAGIKGLESGKEGFGSEKRERERI